MVHICEQALANKAGEPTARATPSCTREVVHRTRASSGMR